MSKEQKYTAVILKKQPYKEGDEIITLFTKQVGKMRCLAKGVKKPLSKLQQKLQMLFLVEVNLAGGDMLKIIGVEPIKVFANIRENLFVSRLSFYTVELVLKFTADEQKNEQLFNLLTEYLEFLDSVKAEPVLNLGLAKFKINMLEVSGLGINFPDLNKQKDLVFFSLQKGGFLSDRSVESLPVSKQAWELFLLIKKSSFEILKSHPGSDGNDELQSLLSQFIEYQLERKIKSEKYLI